MFTVSPGLVHTALTDHVLSTDPGQRWFSRMATPRWVEPELGAQLVVLLASGKADVLSGRFLRISDNIKRPGRSGRGNQTKGPLLAERQKTLTQALICRLPLEFLKSALRLRQPALVPVTSATLTVPQPIIITCAQLAWPLRSAPRRPTVHAPLRKPKTMKPAARTCRRELFLSLPAPPSKPPALLAWAARTTPQGHSLRIASDRPNDPSGG